MFLRADEIKERWGMSVFERIKIRRPRRKRHSLSLSRQNMDDTPTFVDVQGFIVDDKFAVKEAAILRSGKILAHYVFEAPTAWQSLSERERRSARWLIDHHHGLRWTDGWAPYAQAGHLLREAVTTDSSSPIYAKGLEKSEWLRNILGERYERRVKTIDADFTNITRLSNLTASPTLKCVKRHPRCAIENVFKLQNWWTTDRNEEKEEEKETRRVKLSTNWRSSDQEEKGTAATEENEEEGEKLVSEYF